VVTSNSAIPATVSTVTSQSPTSSFRSGTTKLEPKLNGVQIFISILLSVLFKALWA
jgi:hypothetical protein